MKEYVYTACGGPSEWLPYTVAEFVVKFRPDGKGHIAVYVGDKNNMETEVCAPWERMKPSDSCPNAP